MCSDQDSEDSDSEATESLKMRQEDNAVKVLESFDNHDEFTRYMYMPVHCDMHHECSFMGF